MKDTYFKTTEYGVSSDIEKLREEINKIWIEINAIKEILFQSRREENEDEDSAYVKPKSTPHSK